MSETEAGTTGERTGEEPHEGLLAKAAHRGDDALRRLREEADKRERGHEALERLDDTRARLEDAGRSLLRRLNLAPMDEVETLRREVELLELRLAKVEGVAGRKAPAPAEAEPGERSTQDG